MQNDEWISTEERLPEEYESYRGYSSRSVNVLATIQYEDGETAIKQAFLANGIWSVTFFDGAEVIAWKPLPEPYKRKHK